MHPQKTTHQQLLHVEDEVYLAAAAGCTMGIIRHPLRPAPVKMEEIIRAVRWHRLAPPFGAQLQPVKCDSKILFDSWFFPPGSFWDHSVINKTIRQGAPASLTRGLPLPAVSSVEAQSDDQIPFVIASQNPNGALSITTMGRTNPEQKYYLLKQMFPYRFPVGMHRSEFLENINELFLKCESFDESAQIWAQDLASDEAEDISSAVSWNSGKLQISGDLIHRIGTSTNPDDDPSEPGMILKILPA